MQMRSTKSSSGVRRSHGLRAQRKNSLCPEVDKSSACLLRALSYDIGTLRCGHSLLLDGYAFFVTGIPLFVIVWPFLESTPYSETTPSVLDE